MFLVEVLLKTRSLALPGLATATAEMVEIAFDCVRNIAKSDGEQRGTQRFPYEREHAPRFFNDAFGDALVFTSST